MKRDVVVAMPSPMWAHALGLASELGHDLERDVIQPALLEYVKIQADLRGRRLARCPACNATTLEGECLSCGFVAPRT